jgi:hypothetical protein
MPRALTDVLLVVFLLCPATAWATRGADDYGLVFAIFFLLFALPVGITLLVFIIYTSVKLATLKRSKPTRRQGGVIFVFSTIFLALTVALPILLGCLTHWYSKIVEMMPVAFAPVLVLAAVAVVLAMMLKKRSQAALGQGASAS